MEESVTRLSRSTLSLSLSLSLSKALFHERRFDVSFGDSSRRRILRCLSSASSSPVTLLGDLSLCGPPRRFVGYLSPWDFSSKISLGGSNRSFHLRLKDRRIKVHRAKVVVRIESTVINDLGEDQSFQSSATIPSVNGEDEATARPIGVKAAKAKAKRSVGEEGKNLQDFQQMWELKAKDIAAKETHDNKKLLDKLLGKTEPLTDLEVALKEKLIKEIFFMGSSDTQLQMEPRKRIVCGLSARGIIPPLSEEDRDDDVAPLPQEDPVEVVDISDEEEEDIVELSREEYRSNMGYFIRVEESEDDIEPGVRRMLERMQEEEMKLREEKFKVLKSGIKQEKGQSSKGDGNKRNGRK
ncbi:hypothetical protein YC2023_109408 [Brassica napus]